MKRIKISFDEGLNREVVKAGRCAGCAACVIVCPLRVLGYEEGKPLEVEECKDCGICYYVCPSIKISEDELEEAVFGRSRRIDEEFGVYRDIYVARATDDEILASCQDGGVVTSLISTAFMENLIDGAAVSGLDEAKPFYPNPKLVSTREEAISAAGTRYSYSPNLFAFKKGVDEKKARLAFVGTPCQIKALRRITEAGLKKYSKPLKFIVGLFCSECFVYEGLMNHIRNALKMEPHEIQKMNIKGKMIITSKSGNAEIPLKALKSYVRPECQICRDFSAELADISVGGVGLEGWTFTVVRSEVGEELINSAVNKGNLEVKSTDKEGRAYKLLVRLSRIKRKREE